MKIECNERYESGDVRPSYFDELYSFSSSGEPRLARSILDLHLSQLSGHRRRHFAAEEGFERRRVDATQMEALAHPHDVARRF